MSLRPLERGRLEHHPGESPHKSRWLCLELSQETLITGINDRKSRAGRLVNILIAKSLSGGGRLIYGGKGRD